MLQNAIHCPPPICEVCNVLLWRLPACSIYLIVMKCFKKKICKWIEFGADGRAGCELLSALTLYKSNSTFVLKIVRKAQQLSLALPSVIEFWTSSPADHQHFGLVHEYIHKILLSASVVGSFKLPQRRISTETFHTCDSEELRTSSWPP